MGLTITSTNGLSRVLERPGDRVFISIQGEGLSCNDEHTIGCHCIVYLDNEAGNPQVLPLNPVLLNDGRISVLTSLNGTNSIKIGEHELTLEAIPFPAADSDSISIPANAVAAISNEGNVEFSLQKLGGGGQIGQISLVPNRTYLIGRALESDIVVSGETVSRNHLEISSSGSTVIINPKSENSTFVNGVKVSTAIIKNGDILQISDYRFIVDLKAPQDAPLEEVTTPPEGNIEVSLIREDCESPSPVNIEPGKEYILGRSRGSYLDVNDPRINESHCTFSYQDQALTIKDFNSLSPDKTFKINGRRAKGAGVVRTGDTLSLRGIEFKVRIVEKLDLLKVINNSTNFTEPGDGKKEFSLSVLDGNSIDVGERHTFYLPPNEIIFISKIDNQIVINDDGSVKETCMLTNSSGEISLLAIEKLPVKVNEGKRSTGILSNGNKLQVGKHALFKFTEIDSAQLERETAAGTELGHYELLEQVDDAAVDPGFRPRTGHPVNSATPVTAVSSNTSDKTSFKFTISSPERPNNKLSMDVVPGSPITLGRQFFYNNSLVCAGNPQRVSGDHFILHANGGKVFLEHIGRYSTIIDGGSLQKNNQVELKGGEKIKMGDEQFSITFTVGVEKIDPNTKKAYPGGAFNPLNWFLNWFR